MRATCNCQNDTVTADYPLAPVSQACLKKNTPCATMTCESLEELLCALMKTGALMVADRSEKMN